MLPKLGDKNKLNWKSREIIGVLYRVLLLGWIYILFFLKQNMYLNMYLFDVYVKDMSEIVDAWDYFEKWYLKENSAST